jgi:hypothetical protein
VDRTTRARRAVARRDDRAARAVPRAARGHACS